MERCILIINAIVLSKAYLPVPQTVRLVTSAFPLPLMAGFSGSAAPGPRDPTHLREIHGPQNSKYYVRDVFQVSSFSPTICTSLVNSLSLTLLGHVLIEEALGIKTRLGTSCLLHLCQFYLKLQWILTAVLKASGLSYVRFDSWGFLTWEL